MLLGGVAMAWLFSRHRNILPLAAATQLPVHSFPWRSRRRGIA